ncbi:M20 family metallopeptidase [uncultured Megasphaera sp.]|uniref:M20 metallopeptidase family protein n=1 Tax=uncultured Megasphaera sp. TaxID=165188 RepID=UPI002659572E|nr:amidohydrolase [uncultured Megasphaera sp.]
MNRSHIFQEVRRHGADLTALRRHFHEYPELSKKETQTMAYIQDTLTAYGIPSRHIEKGGIIAWIQGRQPGKTLLLRADIDALPIEESEKNLSVPRVCRSKHDGVMHACGHDGHMAMMLTAANLLNQWKDQWDGTIVIMFEQGEEESGPLEYLLHYIEEESPWHIDACYATHVRWDIPAGKIAVCHDAPMAGGFGFEIVIKGQGGHGSRPDLARSPIDCFHAFYGDLQALRMRTVSPLDGLTISVGSVHSGSALNIIPNELTFAGTCRFFSYDHAGKRFYEEFHTILKNACQTYGCTYEILHMPKPLFEVQNNPVCVSLAEEGIRTAMGDDVLTDCIPWMASESFAITTRLYPGVLTFTGIENKEKGCGANHHTPEFDLDEDGLIYGTTACLSFALTYLQEKPDIPFTRPDEPLSELAARNI